MPNATRTANLKLLSQSNEANTVSQRPSDFGGGVAPYALNPDNAARLWAIAQTLIS
jgi:hypothetical protein